MDVAIRLTVNGKAVEANVDPRTLLVQLIRERLQLTGTHVGCDTAQCGACTVHMNGRAVKSCSMLALQAQGADITTIEGLAPDGELIQVPLDALPLEGGCLLDRFELRQVIAVPKLPPSTGSDVRSRIVAIARSQLGQGEHPPGSNCTKFGPCEEWCADFATWVWRQAGVAGIGRIAWVPNLPAWGRSRRSWKPGYNNDPQPGDMVIFSGLHVGLVERVTAGTITIIAGNTSTNNVARRGPASPAHGYAMGPAAISGYVSPVPVGGSARTTAAPLPRPTAAQMAAQDPQSRDPRLAAQER